MRIERDTMGEMPVPDEALWGAQTARAVQNFPVSGRGIGPDLVHALGRVKAAAAKVNRGLGLLPPELAEPIEGAANEVAKGLLDSQFPVDVFQTGSGTSSNMNANEVIAHRAAQLARSPLAPGAIHPNDHVNLGQSSNDVVPTATHLAARILLEERLLPALEGLLRRFEEKVEAFDDVVTTGRTHLQDATPIRLSQVFSGYVAQVAQATAHLRAVATGLEELAIGGTAVGTGLNTHPRFGALVAAELAAGTGLPFREAANHFAAQSMPAAAVRVSGALRNLAADLLKISTDLRWLGSGPRLGLGEIEIPAVQPGSSIMPGKTNPVIAESLAMVCAQVVGLDAAITLGGLSGGFQLNTMWPLIASDLVEQIRLLAAGTTIFAERLVAGLTVDRVRIASRNERSLALATALAPAIGYENATEIAREAHASGRTVREVARDRAILPEAEIERLLDPRRQTEPGR